MFNKLKLEKSMKKILLLVLTVAEIFTIELNPLSDEFINRINSKQNTWTAGRNFNENTPMINIRKLLGAKRNDASLRTILKFVHNEYTDIPGSFNAREQWPECKDVISQIADQSHCASSWAVAAASAMTDRRCIHSKGKLQIPVSALDILSCTNNGLKGCEGGFEELAWNYWYYMGIVTGGAYNSSEGCRPYPMEPCEHVNTGNRKICNELHYDTPECTSECDNASLTYRDELTFATRLPSSFVGAKNIQREILANGPVETTFQVYSDFLNYKSGVYKYTAGEHEGDHAVRIIGWGVEEDIPYWLVANSWNEDWGDYGYFKILRGSNELGFEDGAVASLPKV